MLSPPSSIWQTILRLCICITLALPGLYATPQPSHDRDWVAAQKLLPNAVINGETVTINNVRNNKYTSVTEFTSVYENRTYTLSDMQRMWFIVTPFGGNDAVAHTYLSFEFANDVFINVSVEARYEQGEAYSPFKGIFKQYELIYVVADEQDTIAWRTDQHKLDTFVYPLKADAEFSKKMFVDILQTVNEVHTTPKFYNTISHACNSSLFTHMNNVREQDIPWQTGVILAGFADKAAHELDLIDTTLPYEEIREYYNVKERSNECANSSNYSKCIRKP